MIAKLQGENKFMGDHIELVVLFQAAEIERLTKSLEEYRVRFAEVEEKELDRHSYEVQIKELAQQLAESGTFKFENVKLKEFIKKQIDEIEMLKGKTQTHQEGFSQKYEESLLQIDKILLENRNLCEETEQLKRRVNELADANTILARNETRIALLSQEIERLNYSTRSKEEEVGSLNSQLQNSTIRLSTSTQEVEQLKRRLEELK